MNARLRATTALVLALLLGAAGAAYAVAAATATPARVSAPPSAPAQLYYRAADGQVAVVPADGSARPALTGLRCVRFAAAGRTRVCLTAGAGPLAQGAAVVLDDQLRELHRYPLAGAPSRAQVSRSGRMVAWTVFVTGDSYAGAGFSVWTSILDTRTGEYLANIESIPLTLGGRRYYAPDINYWGVTFTADDNHFYATLGTKGRTYLVAATMREFEARAVREGVECPSLSPDGSRLAFKKRAGKGWRLSVLDLATGRVTALAEHGSVDDQAVWLGDDTVAYSARGDVWTVAANGEEAPRKLLRDASSPVLVTTSPSALTSP